MKDSFKKVSLHVEQFRSSQITTYDPVSESQDDFKKRAPSCLLRNHFDVDHVRVKNSVVNSGEDFGVCETFWTVMKNLIIKV